MAIPPRTLARPFLRAALTWAEPLCCSYTRCTPPVCQSPSGPEAPSCYPAGRERLRAAPQLLLGGLLTQPCTPSHKAPSPTSPRSAALAPAPLSRKLHTGAFMEKRVGTVAHLLTPLGQVPVPAVCSLTQQGADEQSPKLPQHPAPVLLLSMGSSQLALVPTLLAAPKGWCQHT